MGAGGAGRSRTGGLRTWGDRMLGAQTVGAEGAGPRDRRCGAETGVVSGRAPHPPLLRFLAPRTFAPSAAESERRRLKPAAGVRGGGRQWLAGARWPSSCKFTGSRGSAALTCAAALCWGAGSRDAKALHPGPPLARRPPETPEGGLRPAFGAGPAEQPGLRLPGRGNEDQARIARVGGGLGDGAGFPSPRCRDPPPRPPPPPAGGALATPGRFGQRLLNP